MLSKTGFIEMVNDKLKERSEIKQIMGNVDSWTTSDLAVFLSKQAQASGQGRHVSEAQAQEEMDKITGTVGQNTIDVRYVSELLDTQKNAFYDATKFEKGCVRLISKSLHVFPL